VPTRRLVSGIFMLHCCLNAFGPNVLEPKFWSIRMNFFFCSSSSQSSRSLTNSCQSSCTCPSSALDIVWQSFFDFPSSHISYMSPRETNRFINATRLASLSPVFQPRICLLTSAPSDSVNFAFIDSSFGLGSLKRRMQSVFGCD
jgi:hypothetical protein